MMLPPDCSQSPALQRDLERLAALQREVAQVGLFRRGSLLKVHRRCGKAHCACKADPPRLHGPYLQWTRKVAAKTVSVHVAREQQMLFGWIANPAASAGPR
jgi:hypothetical protein